MNNLKFRAYYRPLGIMYYGVSVYADGSVGLKEKDFKKKLPEEYTLWDDGDIIEEDLEKDIFEKHASVLMGDEWIWMEEPSVTVTQYTGINDRDGQGIYFGDIVKHPDFEDEEFLKVCYEDGCTYVGNTAITEIDLSKGERINNIFEKPELLNK